jgi:hypothetical protein
MPVVFVAEFPLAAMQAHTNADFGAVGPGMRGELSLSSHCRGHSIGRPGEDGEEAVALRPELNPTVRLDPFTDDSTVLTQQFAVPVAQRLDEPGSSLRCRSAT